VETLFINTGIVLGVAAGGQTQIYSDAQVIEHLHERVRIAVCEVIFVAIDVIEDGPIEV
jgi:hypothetical protein